MNANTQRLAYWIGERYAIHIRREEGLTAPWSLDPSMGTVRYCNVMREDDKVTRWMAEHWRPKYHAVWQIVLARMLNYIPTLEALLPGLEWGVKNDQLGTLKMLLKDRRKEGLKVFTAAYTISTCGKSMDKVDYVMDWVVRSVQEIEERYALVSHALPHPFFGDTLAATHGKMTCVDGLGSFLAAQVIADLKNTLGHPLQSAEDWWTWAAPGPGSLRGLNWFFHDAPEGSVAGRVTSANFTPKLLQCYEETLPYIPNYVPRLHMQDFQNCMCEFSKYMRFTYGDGRVRNRYSAR